MSDSGVVLGFSQELESALDVGVFDEAGQPMQSGAPVISQSGREMEDKPPAYLTQWARLGDKGYVAAGLSVKPLPGGVYSFVWQEGQLVYVPQPQQVDELFDFPDSAGSRFLDELRRYFESGARYAEFGFKHRRGFLLYGRAGGGKSSLVQRAMAEMLGRGGVVFLGNGHPGMLKIALDQLRIIEPRRYVLCVFEDIDAIIKEHGEAQLLSLLDGEGQVDYCVNLATTNYPDLLDKRVQRRRRFDTLIRVDLLDAAQRRLYFEQKLGTEDGLVGELVQASEGMTLADMADLIISVKCLALDKEAVVREIREMRDRVLRVDRERAVGFGGKG